MSQTTQILQYLKENGSITTWDCIQELRCTRLSAYILILKQQGHKITPVRETNGKKWWTRYYLVDEK